MPQVKKTPRAKPAKAGIALIIGGQQLGGLSDSQAKALIDKSWLVCHGSIEKDGTETRVNSPGIHIDPAAGEVMYLNEAGKVVRRRKLADAAVEAHALVGEIQKLGFGISTNVVSAATTAKA